MLISYKNNFVFIHIPKCAGDSFEKALNQYSDEIYCEGYLKHQNISYIKNNYKSSDFFVFCIFRRPSSLLKSWYQYHLSDTWERENHPSRYELARQLDLISWVKCPHTEINTDDELLNFFTINDIINVDYIGTVETLNEDLNYIENRLGVNITLEHLNKSLHINVDTNDMLIIDDLYNKSYKFWKYLTIDINNRKNIYGKNILQLIDGY